MKSLSYKRIYKSQEYLATLGTIEYRSLFGSYSLTVDDTVFAMVSDGELYLRACEQSAQYCVKHPPVWLTYKKCGRSVTLNYYRVDESLSVEIFSRCSAEREKHAQYPGKTERFAQYVFSSGSDSRGGGD